MGQKAAKKQFDAAEATDASRRGKQDGKQDSGATSGHGNADLDGEEASEQRPSSTPQKKLKKAPVANMIGKPTTATKAKGSEFNGTEKKTDSKKQGPVLKSNSTPIPAVAVRPASPKEVSAFMSPIVTILIGPFKQSFAAHQAILAQSPVLEKLCNAQLYKKSRSGTCLLLPDEEPLNFVALLQYLYTGQSNLNLSPSAADSSVVTEEVTRTAKKLARLYAIGTDYELEELLLRVRKDLKATRLMEKLCGIEFFEFAEKLYPGVLDPVESEDFARFFAEHAPEKVRTVPQNRTNDLLRMVSNGDAFAKAIFEAYNMAVRTSIAAENEMKAEQAIENKSPEEVVRHKRGRDEDGQMEDKHVGKRARVESDMPGDGKAEDLSAEAAVSAGG